MSSMMLLYISLVIFTPALLIKPLHCLQNIKFTNYQICICLWQDSLWIKFNQSKINGCNNAHESRVNCDTLNTLSVVCPVLSNIPFIFCIKLSSFHQVNISMPYAVQSGAICFALSSWAVTFGIATAARTSRKSGTRPFTSVITFSQEKFFNSEINLN